LKSGIALSHPSPLLRCSTSRLLRQSCCASTVAALCWTQSKTSQCWRWPICTSYLATDTAKLWNAVCTGCICRPPFRQIFSNIDRRLRI